MEAEIKKQKIPLLGIESFNKKMGEVKETDPVARALGITVPGAAEKIMQDGINQELIFKSN